MNWKEFRVGEKDSEARMDMKCGKDTRCLEASVYFGILIA